MSMGLPPANIVRALLDYCEDTGVFRWKSRPRAFFKTDRAWRSFNALHAGNVAGSIDSKGYGQIGILGVRCLSHRVAFAITNGSWPRGDIDHIDGNRLNNAKSNLRIATKSENSRNTWRRASNKSGVTGVSWHKSTGKWAAYICVNDRQFHLGVFETIFEAAAARISKQNKLGFSSRHGTSPPDRRLERHLEKNREDYRMMASEIARGEYE